jgi:hypothetical protein
MTDTNAVYVKLFGAPEAKLDWKQSVEGKASDRVRKRGECHKVGTMFCDPDLWLSFFFDGTRNNFDRDKNSRSYSNIARLHQAHITKDPTRIIHSEYFSGVGTLYYDEITKQKDPGEYYGKDALGAGMAKGGQLRLDCAMARIKKRISDAETNTIGKIKKIHVAIFGFSRGATLARAFALMLEKATRSPENPDGPPLWPGTFGSYKFEIYYMGLFDTVASVGLARSARGSSGMVGKAKKAAILLPPGFNLLTVPMIIGTETADGHAAWASDLHIPGPRLVKQCLHLVAAHEMRRSFPLDLIEEGSTTPPNCTQYIYPGVHSNVGGGYWPGEQGRGGTKPEDDCQLISQIPLHHMFCEAWKAGVPLRNPLSKHPDFGWTDKQEADFKVHPETVKAFNQYLSSLIEDPHKEMDVRQAGGQTILQIWLEAHMGAFFRWRATVACVPPVPDLTNRKEDGKKDYHEGVPVLNKDFVEDMQEARRTVLKNKEENRFYVRLLAEAWKVCLRTYGHLSAGKSGPEYDTSGAMMPSEAQIKFFRHYVHDSAAEFAKLDGTRLSVPRLFYVGKDNTSKVYR